VSENRSLTSLGEERAPQADFSIEEVSWHTCRDDLYHVRRVVFIEEQHVPPEIEIDEWDEPSRHVLARDRAGLPIGCGRLLPDGHIGRMAVLAAWRGRGVGRVLLRHLIALAHEAGMSEVVLSAQVHAIGFYEKEGFTVYGEVYDDAGIPHQAMRRQLRQPEVG